MTVMLKRIESENIRKKQLCLKAKTEILDLQKTLSKLRIQVQQNFKAINAQIAGVTVQIESHVCKLSSKRNRKIQEIRSCLEESTSESKRKRIGLSDEFQLKWKDLTAKNMVDMQGIVSIVRDSSLSRIESERKLNLCLLELKRSNIMCRQYKELFEQEQGKVFELVAEKAVWFSEKKQCVQFVEGIDEESSDAT